ncbi:Octanoyltransferase [Candidatus Johnevansia muelleri]|uniref:Octanoyltransferase n=1 Tax=Candidatus Johnevansia muelleri TaxID=1495769 RepID=A0A078KEG1_9GAMM|nr:Octanoyltransferase [Candidatus Evansia muelleri]
MQEIYIYIYHIGICNYKTTLTAMQEYTYRRSLYDSDNIWLIEHDPVFTQGGNIETLIKLDIPIIKSDRGGKITYHGPGQLIFYILFDLKRSRLGVRELVTIIEKSTILTLATHGIFSYTKESAPGVYVLIDGYEAKISSIGIRIKRGCSFHGLAYNVDMDITPFEIINPCGYFGMQMTQLKDFMHYYSITIKIEYNRWIKCFYHKISSNYSFLIIEKKGLPEILTQAF